MQIFKGQIVLHALQRGSSAEGISACLQTEVPGTDQGAKHSLQCVRSFFFLRAEMMTFENCLLHVLLTFLSIPLYTCVSAICIKIMTFWASN